VALNRGEFIGERNRGATGPTGPPGAVSFANAITGPTGPPGESAEGEGTESGDWNLINSDFVVTSESYIFTDEIGGTDTTLIVGSIEKAFGISSTLAGEAFFLIKKTDYTETGADTHDIVKRLHFIWGSDGLIVTEQAGLPAPIEVNFTCGISSYFDVEDEIESLNFTVTTIGNQAATCFVKVTGAEQALRLY